MLAFLVESHAKSALDQALTTMLYLCTQFRDVMIDHISQASLAGQDVSTNVSMSRNRTVVNCMSFVKLSLGQVGPQAVWPALFCCLRCGDAVAACEIWQLVRLNVPAEVNDVVGRVLSTLAQRQGNLQCFWEAGMVRIQAVDMERLSYCAGSAANAEMSNIYQVGFYALLSGVADLPSSETAIGMGNLEDFLAGRLWRTLMSDNPNGSISSLADSVEQWDPEYLGDAGTGGWIMALPLIMVQRYSKALQHLASTGGSTGFIQAVHLGIVISKAQLAHSPDMERMLQDVVTSLLLAYSSMLVSQENAGPHTALEYIVYIPSSRQARKEVASLIARTGTVDSICGTIDENGVRRVKTLLDKHFSADDIPSILTETAEILSRSNEKQKLSSAAICFLLAGRYGNVVSLLNKQLCPPEIANEDRQYWIKQTEVFLQQYIDRRSYVLETLERQNEVSLVHTSRALIQLNVFFGKLRDRKYGECLNIIDSLHILPVSSSDMAVKESEYHKLDASLRQAYPAIVVGTMEALHHQYQSLKMEHANISSVARQRLSELQTRARLLSAFAGIVSMTGEQIRSMKGYEALMI
jgi:Nup93/Nic96